MVEYPHGQVRAVTHYGVDAPPTSTRPSRAIARRARRDGAAARRAVAVAATA